MEFYKKIDTFEMFGLSFEIKKDKKTKCRIIFCNGVMLANVDINLGYFKQTKNWNKEDIVNKFAEKCASLNIGRKEILSYIQSRNCN